MNNLKFDEEMVMVLEDAVKKAFSDLREKHNENFYYYAFIFDDGMKPYISAWSYEALERSYIEDEVGEEDKGWWKWDYADSPYAVYGYDEFFTDASKLLDNRAEGLSDDELYDTEWYVRLASMEEALRRLDEQGFFGTGEERKKVVINVEQAPPDGLEAEIAQRLNPASELLTDYLQYCEDPEDED